MASPLGKRYTFAAAAARLQLSSSQLYRLVRARAITFHRMPPVPKQSDAGTVRYTRGAGYFFYESELAAWEVATRVEALTPDASLSTAVLGAEAAQVDRDVAALILRRRLM